MLDTAIEKTIWASPSGKKRVAKRLAAMLPAHKVYVEPFAGSAAVLFEKPQSEVEVLNDADPEIAESYRLLKELSPGMLDELREMPWTGEEDTFYRIFDSMPDSDVERLHRFLYVRNFSFGKFADRAFSTRYEGVRATTIRRIERFAPRLANVKVYNEDYEQVVRMYDSPDTVFFLDPPYAGYDAHVGEGKFDEKRFLDVLKSLEGRFLLTYGVRGKLARMLKSEGFYVRRIRTRRAIAAPTGSKGNILTQLVISNYELTAKAFGPGETLVAAPRVPRPSVRVAAATPPSAPAPESKGAASFSKTTRLIKQVEPNDERYVLGIVLEPEVVDAQGDIYSADEIRLAAHRFLEDFGGLGLMHRMRVNGQVKILESYLAPTDMTLGGVSVRKGTWLLAVRVLSDELWQLVKGGELTGFSIGGSARRVPDNGAPADAGTEAA